MHRTPQLLAPPLAALLLALAACAHAPPVPTQKQLEAAEIHFDLGVNAVGQGRTQEALREFLSATKLNPFLPEAHNALGLLYQWSYRRLDDAKAEFLKAVELRPEYPEAWNNLGTLLADLGELPKAREAFEKALADPLYKTPWIAQTNLGWVLHLQGHTHAGEQMVRAALGTRPDYCMGHRQLARLSEAQGRAADAESEWELFAKNCPDEPEALLRLGSIQLKRGQGLEAARSFKRCVERAGARPVATDCRQALVGLPPLPEEAESELKKPAPPGPKDAGVAVDGARDLEGPR